MDVLCSPGLQGLASAIPHAGDMTEEIPSAQLPQRQGEWPSHCPPTLTTPDPLYRPVKPSLRALHKEDHGPPQPGAD